MKPVAYIKRTPHITALRTAEQMADTPEGEDGMDRYGWMPLYEQNPQPGDAKDFIIARLEGQYAEWVRRGAVMEAALRTVMRMADEAKEPCETDPESPAAIRNGRFASIAQVAAQGLGWVSGPPLDSSGVAIPSGGQQ